MIIIDDGGSTDGGRIKTERKRFRRELKITLMAAAAAAKVS
jgi:hypothetical protein